MIKYIPLIKHIYRSVLTTSLGLGFFGVGSSLALSEAPQTLSSISNAVSEDVGMLEEVDLPVSWRQTRARFRPSGASTETESYRETWTYTVGRNGLKWLESPRARVQVFHAIRNGKESSVSAILIEKQNLVRLLGFINEVDLASLGRDGASKKVLRLNLSTDAPGIKTVVNLSEEEQYLIFFRISEKPI